MDASTQVRPIVLLQICVENIPSSRVIECQHPLATVNGSVLGGDVAWDWASAAFTLPSFDTPSTASGCHTQPPMRLQNRSRYRSRFCSRDAWEIATS